MSLSLYVDGERWRSHLRAVYADHPGLVPVVKGNGYGLGLARLARRAAWLGVDTLAVGTYPEVAAAAPRFGGSVLVLTPWRPDEPAVSYDRRVVHTVSRLEDLRTLARHADRPRVVLELLTSMRRHGMSAEDLREAAAVAGAGGVRVEGVALHLPLPPARSAGPPRSARSAHLAEAEHLIADVAAAGLPARRVWVSHLGSDELATLARSHADYELRPRIGTELWLGDRSALRARSLVLDSHPLARGEVFGYRGRAAPRAGTLLVVSGGTAHGIGLDVPTGQRTLRARAASVARGGLDAVGLVRSPFTVEGKQRLFAEPPHMQVSLLFLPPGVRVPAVGEELDVRVRFTATGFDRILVR